MSLLIIEDDASVARFLVQAAREAGYDVRALRDGRIGLETALTRQHDLILLDVMLPGCDGFTICRAVRRAGLSVPILIITARDAIDDKVTGLDSGADDYIVKPFQVGELLARMRAMLRRTNIAPSFVTVADLTLDPVTRLATRGAKRITLSSTEYILLEFLMRNAGRVLTRAAILDHVWQYDFGGNDNVLDVYICYLRGKVDRGFDEPLIHTVRSVGFRMGELDAR